MRVESIKIISFSPTGGTEKLADLLGAQIANRLCDSAAQGAVRVEERDDQIADRLCVPATKIDLTPKENRSNEYVFGPNELVILATPTYAGRVPNKIAPDLRACFKFDGSPAVALVSFGNRSP